MRKVMTITAVLALAGCASGGGGNGSDSKLVTVSRTAVAADDTAARTCLSDALKRVGFTVIENDDDQLRVRGIRPRKEILGIPTSDDFDRIDGYVRMVSGRRTIQLELTTHDGTERDTVSPEVRRDGESVLSTCGAN